MAKPPDNKNRRRYKDPEQDERRIIITDADEFSVQSTQKKIDDTSLKEYGKKEANSLIRLIAKIIKHAPLALTVLLVGIGLHFILEHWFGDPKFFGLLPVKYMFDAGDIALLITLFIMLIRDLWKED